ncbi:MAG: c-type cytochrome [Phycisphaerales bacterium]
MVDIKHITTRLAVCGLALAAAGTLPACRGDRTNNPPRQFFPDMDDSPKFRPQTGTEFFVDGRAMRPTTIGVVPFGRSTHAADPDRANFLKDDPAFFLGRESASPDAAFLTNIPASVVVDEAFILRGQERFNIYCTPCHGFDGKGKGMVGSKWSYPLPSFMDVIFTDKAKEPKAKDGYVFHTIRNGLPNEGKPDDPWKMPPYAHAVKERDAWAIVAYMRTLQASNAGALSDLTETQREQLMRAKPAPAATGTAPPAGGTPPPAAPGAAPAGGPK